MYRSKPSFWGSLDRSRLSRTTSPKPLHEVLEDLVRQHLPVAPVGRAEHAIEGVGVRALDLTHGVRQRGAHVGRGFPNVAPVAALRDDEAVNLWEVDRLGVPEERRGSCRLLVPDIRNALEEQQRQDVRLPVGTIHGAAAEDLGAFPQM